MDDIETLEARVRELEIENERLSTQRATARTTGQRVRTFLSALCLVVAAFLVPVAIITAWARLQLVDEDAFVATLAPLVDEPSVQNLVIDETMGAVSERVDFDALSSDVIGGITDLGVGPRAARALELLQAPLAGGIESIVESTIATVVRSEAFSDVWATALRGSHRALALATVSGDDALVVLTDDGAGISLAPIVEQVKQKLVDRGIGVAQLIPEVDRVIIIGSGDTLSAVRLAYAVTSALGWWLPLGTLALFGAGIALARRRSTAVFGAGVGLALGGAGLAVLLAVGATSITIVATNSDLTSPALEAIYRQLVGDMAQTAWVVALLGALVVVIGWLMGGTPSAARTHALVSSANASARQRLRERGLETGAFGQWLGRHRVLVRVVVAVIAVVWLFSRRPLELGDVLMILVVSLAAAWVLELLQQRVEPDESERTTS